MQASNKSGTNASKMTKAILVRSNYILHTFNPPTVTSPCSISSGKQLMEQVSISDHIPNSINYEVDRLQLGGVGGSH